MSRVVRRAAGADWAFERDSSALVIIEELEPVSVSQPMPLLAVVHVDEVRNSGPPRDPIDVVKRFARDLKRYDLGAVMTDAHYKALVYHQLGEEDIGLIMAPTDQAEIARTHQVTRWMLNSGRLLLARNARLKKQLANVESHATSGGNLRIEIKRRDGSHGDIVAALVLAVAQLTHGAERYRHLAVPSRGVGFDPRHPEAETRAKWADTPEARRDEDPDR